MRQSLVGRDGGVGASLPGSAARQFWSGWLVLLLAGTLGLAAESNEVPAGVRFTPVSIPSTARTGFLFLTAARTGLTFTNTLDELAGAANRVLLNGAGVAAGDFDNDGLEDVFFCSLNGRSALFRNLGNMRFAEVTAASGLSLSNRITRGAVFADLNADGWMDLLVSTLAQGVICLMNDGQGKFIDRTAEAGTASRFGSVTLALADVDGNGTLDLYVTNYRGEDIRDRGAVDLHLVRGQMVVPPALRDRLLVVSGQVLEYGQPDQLLLNDGTGRFQPVPWTAGAFLDEAGKPLGTAPLDWGLTAAFRDLNRDGHPDIYVCNDYWTPDRIWINNGQGRFRAIPRLAIRQISSSAMGVDFADLDRDGYLDFMITDMLSRDPQLRRRQMPARWPIPDPKEIIEHRTQIIQNTLYHNRGDDTYEEIAWFSGVAASDWSWQPVFLDVDLDGFPDLLIPAGHVRDVQDMDAERQIRARQHSWRGFTNAAEKQKAFTQELMTHMRLYPPLAMPIFAFRNTGRLQFEEVTSHWGTAQPGVHHSLAMADFDNDGDLDLVVNNLNGPAGLYRNDSSAPRVAVRLNGRPPNKHGIGAQVTLYGGALAEQTEEVAAGGRYLSGSDTLVVLAAGPTTNRMRLEVRWRGGRTSVIPDVRPNAIYQIDESTAQEKAPVAAPLIEPWFADVSAALGHQHTDSPFDDFARQPLLPKKLSHLGPGVAWFDLNQDGWEDLIIGSGRGGRLGVFVNNQRGGFKPFSDPPLHAPVTRDQTTVLGLQIDGGPQIIAGSSNYEDGLAMGACARVYNLAGQRVEDSLPGHVSSSGPLALADLDGDGDLDLFVAGRVVPGRYPEPASLLLFRNNNQRWEADEANNKLLRNAGLVSGAVWSDLDGDGWPELVLACDWGPLRVYKNTSGQLREITAELGLDQRVGWWNGVTAGDFDGDGRMDLAAGNWGLNSDYQASRAAPVRLYYGDLSGRGMVDIIETAYEPALQDHAPRRRLDMLAPSLPFLMGRFATVKAFSEAPIGAVLDLKRPGLRIVEANSLASVLWLNRGPRFEAVELPYQAQLAPVFGVSVADFNGDGFEDLFLSQNFFDTEAETPRLDAGRGLLLLGDGRGQMRAVPGQQSGIAIYGQQRGAAIADYDHDGRTDLVVTQNGAATRLFRNAKATPGLRVRLAGPPGNPAAIGATLRLSSGSNSGPARELHSGSGYWSQDSSVQVLCATQRPEQLWVRWPGGKVTTTAIPEGAQEVTVSASGQLIRPGAQ